MRSMLTQTTTERAGSRLSFEKTEPSRAGRVALMSLNQSAGWRSSAPPASASTQLPASQKLASWVGTTMPS